MAEVILIYPRSSYVETAMKNQYLPLALLQAVIFVEKEFSVKIIDQRLNKKWQDELEKELTNETLCVGITVLTGEMINNALEISRFIKKKSNIPIIWGGVHPTILPKQTLSNENVDFVVIGEGEVTFYELIKALKQKSSLAQITGIGYKNGHDIIINQTKPLLNLDDLPDPPYHLVDIEKYKIRFNNKDMFVLETSRGCPYRCTFCYSTSFDFRKKWRSISVDNVLKRIKTIKEKFDIDGIEIIDDNFFVDSKRARLILNKIIEEKLGIFFNVNGRINDILRLDNGNLDLLEKSNIRRLATGVESGSQRIRDLIKKDISLEQILSFKDKIDKTKIPPYYTFIGGIPTETEDDLRKSTELMLKLLDNNNRAKVSIFHCFRPLPGTELIDLCISSGLTEPKSLEDWGKYSMDHINHPWITKRLKQKIKMINFVSLFVDNKYEEVDSLAIKIFAKLYKPVAYFRLKTLNTIFFIEYFLLKAYEKVKRVF
ncbi:MAG: radical SAM protein [Patescibacteria group bacterium]